MDNRTYYVIPARKGSKGFPLKNRKLISYTLKIIPSTGSSVVITSDDEEILAMGKERGYQLIDRDPELSNDTASVKDVLLDVVKQIQMNENDIIIMLYLTYAQRKKIDIEMAMDFFKSNGAKSLLCQTEAKSHPYLCMIDDGKNKGMQFIPHNEYRRQSYPKAFKISHSIFIAYAGEIQNLNLNLYNEDTIFFPVIDWIDVDTEEDFLKLNV